jgi:sulfur carrier protein
MAKITVNDAQHAVELPSSLQTILQQLNYTGAYFAVAVNDQFIQRTHYAQTQIQENDKLIIVSPLQGG